MQAGKLRHRITIQTKQVAKDIANQDVETWNDTITVWGSVTQRSGGERVDGDRYIATTQKVLRIRRLGFDVTPAHRVKIGSRQIGILSVDDFEERGIYLDITLKEEL